MSHENPESGTSSVAGAPLFKPNYACNSLSRKSTLLTHLPN